MRTEKIALFSCPSKECILEAIQVTNKSKEPAFTIVDSVGQKPTTNWIHIGTIVYGSSNVMVLQGLCDVNFGPEKFSRFVAKYDTELKSGVIEFAA